MFKAVIFDMDGVLADSEPLHLKAENITLAPYKVHITEEDCREFMGRSSKQLMKSLIRKYSIKAGLEEIFSKHKENLLQLYSNEVAPIKGSLQLLQWFKEKKYLLALASSSSAQLVNSVLKKFKIEAVFDTVVSGSEVEKFKPAPDIFLEVGSRLSVLPEESLVIEDSAAGVTAAKSAGMYCVGFRSPHTPDQDLSQADLIIDDFTIFLDMLKRKSIEKVIF